MKDEQTRKAHKQARIEAISMYHDSPDSSILDGAMACPADDEAHVTLAGADRASDNPGSSAIVEIETSNSSTFSIFLVSSLH